MTRLPSILRPSKTVAALAGAALAVSFICVGWGEPAAGPAPLEAGPAGTGTLGQAPATRPAPTSTSRPFPGAAGPWTLSQEEMAKVMAFAKQHAPDLHDQLEQLRKDDPRRARMLMHSLYQLYSRFQRYPDDVREAALARQRLNIQLYRATRELRAATDGPARDRLTGSLKELLAQQFDKDLIVKEYEVKRLTGQLAELKAELEQHHANRQSIIEERLKKLQEQPASQPGSQPKTVAAEAAPAAP